MISLVVQQDTKWLHAAKDKYASSHISDTIAVLKMIPFIILTIHLASIYIQMSSTFLSQAKKMTSFFSKNPSKGNDSSTEYYIEAAHMIFCNAFVIIFGVPLFNYGLYPLLAKYKIRFTILKRIGVGLFIGNFSVLSTAIIEFLRKKALNNSTEKRSMSLAYMIIPYVFVGIAEILALISYTDFVYNQVPKSMQSICQALNLLAVSFGSTMHSMMLGMLPWFNANKSSGANNINSDNYEYYWLLSFSMGTVNLIAFIYLARQYVYVSEIKE